MRSIILFGCGSALIADFEETLRRLGIAVFAVVRNWRGPCFADRAQTILDIEHCPDLKGHDVALPFFSPSIRLQVARDARKHGAERFATLIDPTAIRPGSLSAAEGAFVNAGAVLGAATELGPFSLINRAATIGHHTIVGDLASVGPGAVCAGEVEIGRGAVVGAGAVVLPRIKIGENSVVAAGAVVTRDVEPHTMVAGNPARVKKSKVAGYGGTEVAADWRATHD